jgi:hypothetical protein
VKVAERTIARIGEIVTGDKGLSPYRSGPQLVRLFNEYGANDVYGQGFPSRWAYPEDKLREINVSWPHFICDGQTLRRVGLRRRCG